MDIVSHFDWLSLSTHDIENPFSLIPTGITYDKTKQVPPPPRYRSAIEVLNGWLAWATNTKQGSLLTMPGKALTQAREQGIGDYGWIEHCNSVSARVTRLDFAIDVFDGGDVYDIVEAWQQARIKSGFRTPPDWYHSLGGQGSTIYFGSKKSPQRIRVYDKAAELKRLGEVWTRIELQARHKPAHALFYDMSRLGVETAGKQRIRALLDVQGVSWWDTALAGDNVDLTRIPKPVSNWQLWLEEQVLTSITNHAHNEDDNAFLQCWITKVYAAIKAGNGL